MTDKILALLALVILIAYLGILVAYVPRIDLGIVVGATVLLVVYDFLFHERRQRKAASLEDPSER